MSCLLQPLPSPGFLLPAGAIHTHALPSQPSDSSFQTSLPVTGPQLPWACLPPRWTKSSCCRLSPASRGPSLPPPTPRVGAPSFVLPEPLAPATCSRLPVLGRHPVFLGSLSRPRSLEAAPNSCPQASGPFPLHMVTCTDLEVPGNLYRPPKKEPDN